MKLLRLFSIALMALSITMISCTGEDGKDGIDGIDGINGQDGANGQDGTNGQDGEDGQDGTDGQNGVGFDEMTQYGFITLNLSGTRPDGVAFEDANTFKFTPLTGSNIINNNYLETTDVDNDILYEFIFNRFLTAPDDINNDSYLFCSLNFVNLGEDTEELLGASIYLNNYAVIGDDNKYFTMSDYYGNGNPGVSDFQFTNFSFDSEDNNHLTYSFSFEVLGANNSSGNHLNVSGTVDVYLLEEVTQ
ncbi:hypothetical protein PY092_19250 [Muricauda sp. 334s03]|uniref:Collagen-like protein n=1 Tax=Flagellimonas yonaguniensis TaxID=3031325 RepID=A0ABT5Y4D4_9FLAO|nr:hypothetical protein [[Muricauda] yonaguniensis]MDF0718305.1 hypothetical protein [[Muricauda] yonaguniensis]